jgi:hypothetical protein
VRPRPSEATRPSTLDERIARDCARSGVPFHVDDDHLVDRVAAWVELAQDGHDHGPQAADRPRRATVRHQGSGQGRGASANGAAVRTGAAVPTGARQQ